MDRRVVTARQLARDMSSILDTVLEEGAPMTITRRGVPVAELRPLRLIPWTPTEADVACGVTMPEVDLQELELDGDHRMLLAVCRDGFQADEASGALEGAGFGRVALALTHLEIKGLLRRTERGYLFTDLGKDVAQVLRAGSDAGAPEAPV